MLSVLGSIIYLLLIDNMLIFIGDSLTHDLLIDFSLKSISSSSHIGECDSIILLRIFRHIILGFFIVRINLLRFNFRNEAINFSILLSLFVSYDLFQILLEFLDVHLYDFICELLTVSNDSIAQGFTKACFVLTMCFLTGRMIRRSDVLLNEGFLIGSEVVIDRFNLVDEFCFLFRSRKAMIDQIIHLDQQRRAEQSIILIIGICIRDETHSHEQEHVVHGIVLFGKEHLLDVKEHLVGVLVISETFDTDTELIHDQRRTLLMEEGIDDVTNFVITNLHNTLRKERQIFRLTDSIQHFLNLSLLIRIGFRIKLLFKRLNLLKTSLTRSGSVIALIRDITNLLIQIIFLLDCISVLHTAIINFLKARDTVLTESHSLLLVSIFILSGVDLIQLALSERNDAIHLGRINLLNSFLRHLTENITKTLIETMICNHGINYTVIHLNLLIHGIKKLLGLRQTTLQGINHNYYSPFFTLLL